MAKEIRMKKRINSSAVATLNNVLAGVINADNLVTAKESAIEALHLLNAEMVDRAAAEGRTTFFQTGPDEEKDGVGVETLLMQLALAESVINDLARYVKESKEGYGTVPEDVTAPDNWAVVGMYQNLAEISHTLKCGCWGYQEASKH
jgi:hypothetical protein